jgi:hypothetical protein
VCVVIAQTHPHDPENHQTFPEKLKPKFLIFDSLTANAKAWRSGTPKTHTTVHPRAPTETVAWAYA